MSQEPVNPSSDLAARAPHDPAGDAPEPGTPHDPADDAPLDPVASAALIVDQRRRVESATDVDGRLLFGVWGVAWLLGFGLLWSVSRDEPLLDLSIGIALAIFTALLLSAVVITTIHTATRSVGVSGASATQGAMYGWAWFLGFGGIGALGYALGRLDVEPATLSTVMTVASTLLVGALYMAGGAIWQDRNQFALGAWIALSSIAAAVVGFPHLLLLMSLAGGGGMLIGAVAEAARRRRRGALR
ncbi:hypothetical protein [Actinotalea sp. K2]|uniref:hypothetical protein n=1 Tax=Actinotalea sp. K2 TaxID=2939438 RepID=UPI0020174066|nr:hypothetical protein [Actinotalea sp. K2]MCL3861625.1 hypothetical protein [Actinotalea sp. K2]